MTDTNSKVNAVRGAYYTVIDTVILSGFTGLYAISSSVAAVVSAPGLLRKMTQRRKAGVANLHLR